MLWLEERAAKSGLGNYFIGQRLDPGRMEGDRQIPRFPVELNLPDQQFNDAGLFGGEGFILQKVTGPGVVFLGGFKSDMEGTKAVHLQDWAQRTGRAFLRFDYSGHGQSSEAFTDGAIGDWADDAQAAIEALTDGPQVLVGSSMGGWISLILSGRMPERIAGLVGIAAAPDFTEDSMWDGFSDDRRAALLRDGQVALPSEMTAFTGLESSRRNASLGSSAVSPLIGTETVRFGQRVAVIALAAPPVLTLPGKTETTFWPRLAMALPTLSWPLLIVTVPDMA